MELAENGPNVELRGEDPERVVVLAFPYDARIVAAVRGIPHRRFDWDRREWWAPIDDWVGAHVADIVARFPELEPSDEAAAWLRGVAGRWIGSVSTARHDGRGWFALRTRAGTIPGALLDGAVEREHDTLVALTPENAALLVAERAARPDGAAVRCLNALEHGLDLPPTRLVVTRDVDGARLGPGARGGRGPPPRGGAGGGGARPRGGGRGSPSSGPMTRVGPSSSCGARGRAGGCRWTRG